MASPTPDDQPQPSMEDIDKHDINIIVAEMQRRRERIATLQKEIDDRREQLLIEQTDIKKLFSELRGVFEDMGLAMAPTRVRKPGVKRLSEEGRIKISKAQKARWAGRKNE